MSLKIFSGQLGSSLATEIVECFGVDLGDVYLHRFPSGESYCQFKENIRGSDVFLIQPIIQPVNEALMELLIMSDAARRASAKSITAVVPIFPYQRSDRKVSNRTPIGAKLALNLLEAAGINRILTMDLHSGQIAGFTNLPFDNLYAMPIFIEYMKKENYNLKNCVVISPDAGGLKRCMAYANLLQSSFGFIAKKRIGDDVVEAVNLIGDVKDKTVILIDDMTESCGTLTEAAKLCKENGAKEIHAFITHGLLTEKGYDRLASKDCLLDVLVTTNSVGSISKVSSRMKVLSCASLFAQAISRIYNNESVTGLFEIKGF